MTIVPLASVARIHAPSPAEFRERYVRTSTPVVMTGLLDTWPAKGRWSPEYLKQRFGEAMIPSIRTRGGMLEHDARAGVVYQPVRMASFVDGLAMPGPHSRYATFPIDEHLPELARDVHRFDYAAGAHWHKARIWIGPEGAAAPMHRDLPENLYAQLHGRKRFFLYPRESSRRMYPYPRFSSIPNFGQVDAEAPDLDRFPAFAGAAGCSVVLEPGDVLFLPSLWWHQTRSLETTISYNVWWATEFPLTAIVRVAEAYKRIRGLRN